jgi:light-regulated signal transduction histidine kinase (bacteriophytochrome)
MSSPGADSSGTTPPRLSQPDLRLRVQELEERLRATTAERDAAYREIDDLARFISHDLRAPLRGIDGYSKALIEDYGAQMDPIGMAYLEFIFDASRQAASLIEKLIYYIRVQRAEVEPQPIDLSQVAGNLSRRLQAAQPEREVAWVIAADLSVVGDAAMIQELLKNLLENAWKFTAGRARARIEFGRLPASEGEAFFVTDNGAGFNMEYRDQLFLPFQRLHTSHEFEGAGMGLAIARRIVERHQGRIWAEAEVGQGARFYFTIPGGR